jgi:hypothetical protein
MDMQKHTMAGWGTGQVCNVSGNKQLLLLLPVLLLMMLRTMAFVNMPD